MTYSVVPGSNRIASSAKTPAPFPLTLKLLFKKKPTSSNVEWSNDPIGRATIHHLLPSTGLI